MIYIKAPLELRLSLLDAIYQGEPHEFVAVLKAIGLETLETRDGPVTKAFQTLFYQGAIMCALNLHAVEAARRLALGSGDNAKLAAADKRDEETETVYTAVKTQWSRVCDDVGLPKLHKGGNRGRKCGKGANGAGAPITMDAFVRPADLDAAGMAALLGVIADALSRGVREAADARAADVAAKPVSTVAKVEVAKRPRRSKRAPFWRRRRPSSRPNASGP